MKAITADQKEELLKTLQNRFEKYSQRHQGIAWEQVLVRLEAKPEKLWSLQEMERTGGEPDVVGLDPETGEIIFFDCSPESPKERRSLCYDQQALEERKENKPAGSSLQMASHMGLQLLTEDQYRYLQTLGAFDLKTSSWVATPPEIRKLGGALFCDRRYNQVFLYHNGASSYYAARAFRGVLRV